MKNQALLDEIFIRILSAPDYSDPDPEKGSDPQHCFLHVYESSAAFLLTTFF